MQITNAANQLTLQITIPTASMLPLFNGWQPKLRLATTRPDTGHQLLLPLD